MKAKDMKAKDKKPQMTQYQHFYAAQRRIADANNAFLFLVEHGLTSKELEQNIQRRPEVWSRFKNWLDKLP